MTELPVPSEIPTSVFGVCIFTHADRSGCSINTHQTISSTFKVRTVDMVPSKSDRNTNMILINTTYIKPNIRLFQQL